MARDPISVVIKKLKRLKGELKLWNKHTFKNVHSLVKQARDNLKEIQERRYEQQNNEIWFTQEVEAHEKLEEALRKWDALRSQKFKTSWLKDRDRNTKLFRALHSQNKCKSTILALDINHTRVTNQDDISSHIVHYYSNHFNTFHLAPTDLYCLKDLHFRNISNKDSDNLNRVPYPDEIRKAVFDLSADSTPGPDGFPGLFFQNSWLIIEKDMINVVQYFFTNHFIPYGLNSSFVTLIPKVKGPVRIEDFRPIVLGNFLFKVITKILVSRLGPILAKILSPYQYGFIPGKHINHCIALASEGFNCLVINGKKWGLTFKIDIRKAFNTINWDLLIQVCRLMGFSEFFVDAIYNILTSARLSILINGAPKGYFTCSQGVRQGDPLSPLLFCMAEEVLGLSIQKCILNRELTQIYVGPNLWVPPFLFYADDVIIFTNHKRHNIKPLVDIFSLYALISGQCINPAKSKVHFGRNSSNALKWFVTNTTIVIGL